MRTGRLETLRRRRLRDRRDPADPERRHADREHTRDLGNRLLGSWPSYVAYAVSFLTIGIIWVNHHALMDQVERADRVFLFLNVGFLLVVAFILFPTRLVAEHIQDEGPPRRRSPTGSPSPRPPRCSTLMWFYASVGGRLLRPDHDPAAVKGIARSYLPAPCDLSSR